MHHLGHWPLCCFLFRCICIMCICSHISCCYYPFLQGRCAFASKVAHLRDLELRKLAEGLHLCPTKAKAPSTTERYSTAFQKFREWSACFEEVVCLPSDELSVALYLEFLLQQSFPYSALESACYGIYWAHKLCGFTSPCDSNCWGTCLRLQKRSSRNLLLRKNLSLLRWFRVYVTGLRVPMLIFLIFA